MGSFVLQRIFQTALVVLAAALVSFAMFRYVGDPVNNMVGQAATLAQREEMRRALGLDDPVAFQFLHFLPGHYLVLRYYHLGYTLAIIYQLSFCG